MSTSIAVAMSGGLDSSVTAWLLSQQETPVIGLSMLLWDRSEEAVHGRCCGALDLGDAQRVAGACGIAHYTLRMEEEFRRQVVEPFVQDYLNGKTPVPCTNCNTWIKFDLFLDKARSLGAERMATGHYARILQGADGLELHASLYPEKDQSYYLFELTQDQLQRSMFPLGELSKDAVRDLARQAGLIVAEKGESMEICFVKNGIREFVEAELERFPESYENVPSVAPSSVVDQQGRELGQGDPYYRYTVGQRRGLGVATGEKLYVLKVDPAENRVVVGGRDALRSTGLFGERLHWIGLEQQVPVEAVVKIRSRHPGVPSTIRPLGDSRVEIDFEDPQIGVTPGQAAVFYQGSRVLGGCWISAAK
ncbi:MAG: tRNA 2-thiouridine(34) synthase MnmA [Thermoanaerobaculia bacterium]